WFVLRKKMRSASWIYTALMVISVMTLVFWNPIPQDFNNALIPVVLAIAVRGVFHFAGLCCKSFIPDKMKKDSAHF
ncbi:MAG: hypothetical protein V5A47_08490, partial [Bacteroidales bacterium]